MKKTFIALTVLFATLNVLASPLPAPQNSEESINHIVAVVNNDVITQKQVDIAYHRAVKQIKKRGAPMPDTGRLINEILNQLIDQRLQLQLANRLHLKVTNAQLNSAIKSIAKQHGISMATLKLKIKKDGYTYSKFRNEIRDQMLIDMVQHQFLAKDIVVTKNEVDQLIDQYTLRPEYATQYHLIDILVPMPSNPTRTQIKYARAEAHRIMTALHAGTDVKKIKGAEINDLGWETSGALPELFTQQASKMKVNGIAGPLQAQNGYHIIKLLAIKPAKLKLPTRTQARQILQAQKIQKAVHDA